MEHKTKLFGVNVIFKQVEGWSRAYTYLSHRDYKIGEVVVVPTSNFYSIGKVIGITEEPKLQDGIHYKHVTGSIEQLKRLNK